MKMEKRKFRIGELAKRVGVEQFVIRFWEKEFYLKPQRSEGGQRFYDEEDLNRFLLIKELLYSRKFTIAGAREELKKKQPKTVLTKDIEKSKDAFIPSKLAKQIVELQDQLVKLKELL